MVTVKAKTEDVVVVALDIDITKHYLVQLDQGTAIPTIVRIYRDRIEVDAEIDSSSTGQKRVKTFKFWLHDLLLMNETLFRITHPT